MFEKLIVDAELLPLREAASKGDLAAMCQLARHVIEGDRSVICPETTEKLCDAILAHENFMDHPETTRSVLKLMIDHITLLWREGRMSDAEYISDMREGLQSLIFYTVQYPYDAWDIYELKHAVDWLYDSHFGDKENTDS